MERRAATKKKKIRIFSSYHVKYYGTINEIKIYTSDNMKPIMFNHSLEPWTVKKNPLAQMLVKFWMLHVNNLLITHFLEMNLKKLLNEIQQS
jgi:hypothetical protein